ncbi:MAG: hemolysin III family protein [Actinomycetota bacterium]|nr:hemolysin III family protein [Actinomycetota bacterium]
MHGSVVPGEQAAGHLVAAVKPRLRGVLHEGAFGVSLVTGTALIVLAQGARGVTVASVYAAAVSLLFATSAAYHRGSWTPPARARMQRLDHSMIFVLIAGTYTPLSVLLLHGPARWVVFGTVWVGAAVGVIARITLTRRPRWLFPALYAVLGCVALAVLPALLRSGGPLVLVMIVLGGVCYLTGAVIYVRRRPDPWPHWFGFHELFHALTIAAFAAHYVAVSATVYRAN